VVDKGGFADGAIQFRIVERQWSFEPAIIKVNPGDRVRLILTSMDISHGFSINELDINLALSPEEETVREVVIPPDIAEGVYTMYCSVFCGIGHPYMKGKIIIGDPELFLGVGLGRILPYMATVVMAVMFAAITVIGRRRAR
jgi:heme/copper-type cytochrome/quinol oxidase subunit 2